MTRSAIRAGAAFVELKSKDSGFTRGLRKAQRQLEGFGAAAQRIGTRLLAGGGSIVAAGIIATRVFAKMGDELDKMSKRTGFTVETLSALGFAAEQSGADLKTLEKGIRGMQRSINDAGRGLSTQVDALKDLGLSYRELKDLTPEQQFMRIAEAIAQVDDPSKRAALAMQLLGRAGQALVPLMSEGADGIRALMMEAQELGIVVSGEAASAAAHMTDRLNIASRTIKAMTFEIGAALAPTVVKLANIVTGIVVNVTNWIRENQQLVKTIAIVGASVAGAGVALIGLGLAAKIVAISIGGLLSIMSVLGTVAGVTGGALAAVLSPISLISIAIVGLGALILSTVVDIGGIVDNVKTVFRGLAADIFGVLSSITDAIIAGDLETAVKIAGKSIELAWALTMDSLKSAWDGVVDHIANSKLYNSKWAQIGAAGFELGVGRLLGEDDAYLGNLLPNKDGKDANERARDRQKEIEDLTEELRKLRESVPPGALGDRAAAFLSAFEGFNGNLGATSATGPSVRGLFDATAIGSLASPVEDKIEKHTRQTADNTKRMREAIERGGGGLRYT